MKTQKKREVGSIVNYHIIYYNGLRSKNIDLDFYLNILDNINTPEEQIALGRNIIARIYVQVKA